MLYLLHTIPGLGEFAWNEAERRLIDDDGKPRVIRVGYRLVPGRNDLLLVRYSGNPQALLKLRVCEDLFAVAVRAFNIAPEQQGLRQMYAATNDSRLTQEAMAVWKGVSHARSATHTFRVIARKVGDHRFRRNDMGKAVSDAIKAGWPGRWRLVEDDAAVEVWATLLGQELVCGVRLSGPEMRKRDQTQHLPAALRPALAAAMIVLTEPTPEDRFLDPMAGSGTLLVERAAFGPFRHVYGGDSSSTAVRAIRTNTRHLYPKITCEQWDVHTLPLPDQSIDTIATNLPFGKQVVPDEDLPTLYRAALAEMQRVLRPGGRMVVLVGDTRLLDSARSVALRLRPGPRQRVHVLGMWATICAFTKQTD